MANRFDSKTKGLLEGDFDSIKSNMDGTSVNEVSPTVKNVSDPKISKSIRIKRSTEDLIDFLKLKRGLKMYELLEEMTLNYATDEEKEIFNTIRTESHIE